MKTPPKSSISRMLSSLCASAIEVQQKFDDQFKKEAEQFVIDYAKAPKEQRLLLLPAAPRRQKIATYEVSTRISWRKEKSISASLQINFLNLSADLRYQRDVSKDSSIKIQIEQIPSPIQHL